MKSVTIGCSLLFLAALAACGGPSPAEEAVARTFAAPSSAKFQDVRNRGDHVCGEVNGKNATGRYGVYRRFVFEQRSGLVTIEPEDRESVGSDAEASACGKPQSYQTVAERLSCAAPAGRAEDRNDHETFESLWRRACS